MPLNRQVVLVSGCSSGIGRALALEFARAGHRVFASARKPEDLHGLEALGLDGLALDVTDPTSVEAAVAAVIERAERVDVLVNNAGLSAVGPLAEVPLDTVRRLFETNVTGLLAMVQAVFPTWPNAAVGASSISAVWVRSCRHRSRAGTAPPSRPCMC